MYDFSFDYNDVFKCDMLNIHKYLLRFSKSLATKCVSLNNESCLTRSFLNDLNLI